MNVVGLIAPFIAPIKIMADDMTNEQFDKFIKLIITIANDSDSKEEFIEKIEALIKNN